MYVGWSPVIFPTVVKNHLTCKLYRSPGVSSEKKKKKIGGTVEYVHHTCLKKFGTFIYVCAAVFPQIVLNIL